MVNMKLKWLGMELELLIQSNHDSLTLYVSNSFVIMFCYIITAVVCLCHTIMMLIHIICL